MTNKSLEIEPEQPWTVDRFQPEDASGVAALFHSVYGEKYPVATFLDPDLLVRENLEDRVISSVARIPSGAIVGHNALFNSVPNSRIFETGAGVVHKLYRGGHGIFTQVTAHGIEMGRQSPLVDLIFGEPVCNHPFSQKMCIRLNYFTRAMEVNLMPAQAYTKEKSATGRVSTLLGFIPIKPKPCTVFVPKGYTDQFALCYEDLVEEPRTFEVSLGEPETEKSRITVQTFDFAQVARVAVPEPGKDFAARMGEKEDSLVREGIRVIQVWLNTGVSQVGWAADILRSQGYFFGGVLPRWFDTDGLLMQKVLDAPDWEGMVLVGERNERVAALVRKEWALVQE